MSWGEVLKTLVFWGPGAVLAGVLIYVGYMLLLKLADKLIDKFGNEFIVAQKAQAEAMTKQALSLEKLETCIQGILVRDDRDHQDIKIMLKVVIDRLERGYQ